MEYENKMMKRRWVITVDAMLPSANTFMRFHWSARQKSSFNWRVILSGLANRLGIPSAKEKRGVRITVGCLGVRDPQNAWLAADKLCLDNLVKLGLLVDDSAKWAKVDVVTKREKEPKTVIELWDMGGRNGHHQPHRENK